MAKKPLERYIELKQQISALEKELDEIKDEVFQWVDGQGGEVAEDTFTIRSYKNPKYKFSETYENQNADLKALRKKEIEDGTAVVDGYSEFVKINFKKAKES